MKKFKLPADFVAPYRSKTPSFGYDGLGELVCDRTYARKKPDGTMEKWVDIVERVVNGTFNMEALHFRENNIDGDEDESMRAAMNMFDRIFAFKMSPPGRGLWIQGTDVIEKKKLYAALNNCAFISTAWMTEDPVMPFAFVMEGSMLGIGVGFDTEGAYPRNVEGHVAQVVRFARPLDPPIGYVITDDREGWVESVRIKLRTWFYGTQHACFDYSKIRPAGSSISTFGGVASGPEYLQKLHEEIDLAFNRCIERNDACIVDVELIADLMNLIGVCVVSGNVRRTALIAFGRPGCREFINLKNADVKPYRNAFKWTSNNSIFAEVGMDYNKIVYGNVTLAQLMASTGEPGLAYLENMRNYGRMGDPPDYKDSRVMGANPCVTKDSIIHTNRGPRTVEELIGKSFETPLHGVYYKCEEGFFSTGVRPVFRVQLANAHYIDMTSNHLVQRLKPTHSEQWEECEFVQVRHLNPGDELVINNTVWSQSRYQLTKWNAESNSAPFLSSSYENQVKYLKSIERSTPNSAIENLSADVDYYPKDPVLMIRCLLNFGIRGRINGNTVRVNGIDSELLTGLRYDCYESQIEKIMNNPRKRRPSGFKVASITPIGDQEVYDCHVSTSHMFGCDGVVVHNCLEQSLEHGEMCTLVETFPARHDDINDFMETLKLAFRYAKIVTTAPPQWPVTNEVMKRNRRIGLSISGVAQFIGKHGDDELHRWCDKGYNKIKRYDKWLSEYYKIPMSIKITSIKPSGTVSLLAGATPGVHEPISRFYRRRVRGIIKGSLVHRKILAKGVRCEDPPEIEKAHGHLIAVFPIDEGEGVKGINGVTLEDQLKRIVALQKDWADNQISATVTVKPHERALLPVLLAFYDKWLKGVSFIFEMTEEEKAKGNIIYEALPYEPITEEEYHMEFNAMMERRKQYALDHPDDEFVDTDESSKENKPDIPLDFCDSDSCLAKALRVSTCNDNANVLQ